MHIINFLEMIFSLIISIISIILLIIAIIVFLIYKLFRMITKPIIKKCKKLYMFKVFSLMIGFPILSVAVAIPGAAFTNYYLHYNHSKNILGSVNSSIIWAFFIMGVIYLIFCIVYTLFMINKCQNKYKFNFYSHMIKFIFSSVIGMIGVFSIALEFIDGSIFNLLNTNKIIHKVTSLNLDSSLMTIFLILSVAFAALIIMTYYYEKILVNKFKEQDKQDKYNDSEIKYLNNILGKL